VSPSTLYPGGGTITVFGSGFSSLTSIKIGDQDCTDVQIISAVELHCTAPAAAGGARSLMISGAEIHGAVSYVDFSKLVTIAGRDGQANTVVDGVGHLARLNQVGAMALAGDMIYFSEYRLNSIRSLDLTTNEVRTLAGNGEVNGGYLDAVGVNAKFSNISGIAKDASTLYLADRGNCAIRKLDLATNAVTTLIGNPPPDTFTSCNDVILDGGVTVAKLGQVGQMVLAGDNLYFADESKSYAYLIRRLKLSTMQVTTLAGGAALVLPEIRSWAPDPSLVTTEKILTSAIETPHPYDGSLSAGYEFSIAVPTATGVRLHFTQFKTDPADEVGIFDDQGYKFMSFKGDLGTDFWSPVIPLSAIAIKLSPSSSGSNYGFKIDKIMWTANAGLPRKHTLDGPGLSTAIGGVNGMAIVGSGLFFVDGESRLVRRLDLASGQLTGFFGTTGFETAVGNYATTSLITAYGLTTDGKSLYLVDAGDDRQTGVNGLSLLPKILSIDASTRAVSTVFTDAPNAGLASNIDGPLETASIMDPDLIVFDPKRGLIFDCVDVIRRLK
jgi:hypothetical protein